MAPGQEGCDRLRGADRLVRCTDATLEGACDRQSHVGWLDKALDEAIARGWAVDDTETDWKRAFAFEEDARRDHGWYRGEGPRGV
jgi:hypothetical protein